jgi:hypothetical protein
MYLNGIFVIHLTELNSKTILLKARHFVYVNGKFDSIKLVLIPKSKCLIHKNKYTHTYKYLLQDYVTPINAALHVVY